MKLLALLLVGVLVYQRKQLLKYWRWFSAHYLGYKPHKKTIELLHKNPIRTKNKHLVHSHFVPHPLNYRHHFVRGELLYKRGGIEHGFSLYNPDDYVLLNIIKLGPKTHGHKNIVHGGELFFKMADGKFGGFTAYLKTDYRKPMPTGKTIVFCSKITSIQGRKIFISSQAFDAETPFEPADEEGLFSEYVGKRVLYSDLTLAMESAYVRETVGPVLTKALAEIVQHYPASQYKSSYSALSDPITLLGLYLLEFDRLHKEGLGYEQQREKLTHLVTEYTQRQKRQQESRVKFQEQLFGRVSVRRSVVDAQIEELSKPAVESVPEPVPEEPAVVPEEPAAEEPAEPVEAQ
ncbi:hypothetical protein EDD86DRAFT_243702 [Gorgonomyces haynaldii]|nr:hypothetical protein EDD86DRAFT_243702 [Gorgonomyces haynaldii]